MKVIRLNNNQTTQYIFRLLGFALWVSTHHKDYGWFRLFGFGVSWKHKKIGLSFCERFGYKKYLKIGNWVFTYIPIKYK